MRNLQEQRSDETISVRKKLAALTNKQGLRVRIVGSSNKSIDSEIKYLEDLRKTLPPLRHETVETVKALSGKTLTGITAGMSGICNDSPYDDVAFWAGGNLEGAIYTMMNPYNLEPKVGQRQANFVVTHRGVIIANQAIIRGNIYATDGIFNGTVYAQDGVFNGTVFASAGEFNGKITSNHEGDRIIIDPFDRSTKMLNSANQEVLKQDFFVNDKYSGGRIKVNLIDQETGLDYCHAEVDGGKIAVYRNGVEFARFDAYQSKIWIDADALPQNRDSANPKEVYMDGEAMKVRRGE